VQSDKGASDGVHGVVISGDVFRNFNGTSWVTFNAADGSPGIGINGRITVSSNVFDSDANMAGGCAAKNGITYAAHMLALHGSDLSSQGVVANVTIDSNTFRAGYVRGGVAIWSGTRAVDVAHNSIQDAVCSCRCTRLRSWDDMRYWSTTVRTSILAYTRTQSG